MSRIQVSVERGVVHLSGSVQDSEDEKAAEGMARSTPGVLHVVNELTT
jgi:osmotically-inducible protein OsmY